MSRVSCLLDHAVFLKSASLHETLTFPGWRTILIAKVRGSDN